MSDTAGPETDVDFGTDERFELRYERIRRRAWWLIMPALFVAAFTVQAEGSAIGSSVLRAALLYVVVLLLVRLGGKRTMAELTTFDLIVILMISEAVQPALVGDDFTIANGMVTLATLIGMDLLLARLKQRSPGIARWLDDVPTILVRNGQPDAAAMRRSGVDMDDIMEAARRNASVTRREAIRFAVLERAGGISVIPWPAEEPTGRSTAGDRTPPSRSAQASRDAPASAPDAPDPVDEAIDESFPASDPPSFTPTHAGTPAPGPTDPR